MTRINYIHIVIVSPKKYKNEGICYQYDYVYKLFFSGWRTGRGRPTCAKYNEWWVQLFRWTTTTDRWRFGSGTTFFFITSLPKLRKASQKQQESFELRQKIEGHHEKRRNERKKYERKGNVYINLTYTTNDLNFFYFIRRVLAIFLSS